MPQIMDAWRLLLVIEDVALLQQSSERVIDRAVAQTLGALVQKQWIVRRIRLDRQTVFHVSMQLVNRNPPS